MKFRHIYKIHTVETTDEGRRQEDNINDGKYLDYFVLFDINQTEEGILEVVQTIKTETGIVEKRVDIFNNHRQTRTKLFREEVAFKDVGYNALFIHYILTDNSHFFL